MLGGEVNSSDALFITHVHAVKGIVYLAIIMYYSGYTSRCQLREMIYIYIYIFAGIEH